MPAFSLTTKIIGGLAVVVIVLGILWLSSCQRSAQQAAQSRVDQGQAGAFRNSVEDAGNTVGAVTSNMISGAEASRRNEEEIRNAQGAAQPVDPDANARGLRALCARSGHRNDAACRVQQPHPR